MKFQFQIGDRVVLVSEYADICFSKNKNLPRGSTGTVCHLLSKNVGVCWDGYTMGHNCAGRLRGEQSKSGYFVLPDELELISPDVEDTSVDIDALL